MAESILWMLGEWTLRTTALAIVVGCLLLCLRVKDVSLRLAVWTMVLAGALLLPLASVVSPQILIRVPLGRPGPSLKSNLPPAPPVGDINPAGDPGKTNDATAMKSAARVFIPREPLLRPLSAAVCAWLAVACILLLRLAIGLWLSHRLVKTSSQVGVDVYESAKVTVPVTVGLMRPVILLPPDWRTWEEQALKSVLAHERTHVRQRDPLRLFAASIYRALCWFHPLAWWLHAHLADLAEKASDDAALALMGDRESYAETLLTFFQRAPRRVRWQGSAMARYRTAAARIERILDSSRRLSRPLSRIAWLALLLVVIPLLYLEGSLQPVWAGGGSPTRIATEADGKPDAAPEWLFERRPLTLTFSCVDWKQGKPDLHPAGSQVMHMIGPGNQSPYVLTRPEELNLSRGDVPALTIAADPNNSIAIAGADRPDWRMRFCAQGSGQTEAEARERLQQTKLSRTGGAISINGPEPAEGHQEFNSLLVDAPADAPLVIHGSYAATEVRDMAAPVRITATAARARILDTTGQVDAIAEVIDFAGSRGRVTLNADEINLKISAPHFEGSLIASAQGDVRVLVPQGFVTPFAVVVPHRKSFVCRAEFCSRIKETKNGQYTFTYLGDDKPTTKPPLRIFSEKTVVIDVLTKP